MPSRLAAAALLSFLLTGCTHILTVHSRPSGAAVRLSEVNGDKVLELGETPVKTEVVASGEYKITLTKPGYSAFTRTVEMGSKDSFSFELVPYFNISVDSEPRGATIVLIDKGAGLEYNIGKTPAQYVVEGNGPFAVRASMIGRKTETLDLETAAGNPTVSKVLRLSHE